MVVFLLVWKTVVLIKIFSSLFLDRDAEDPSLFQLNDKKSVKGVEILAPCSVCKLFITSQFLHEFLVQFPASVVPGIFLLAKEKNKSWSVAQLI